MCFVWFGAAERYGAQQKLVATPEMRTVVAYPGDYLVLCCDGIFEKLSNENLMHFVHQRLCERMYTLLPRVVSCSLQHSYLSRGALTFLPCLYVLLPWVARSGG